MQTRALFAGRILTAAVMLAIFLTMSLVALGFPEKARLMPLLVGIPGSVLSFLQLVAEVRTPVEDKMASDVERSTARANERQMFVWLLLYFFGILGFGFMYGAPLLVFGFLYFGKKETVKAGLLGAVSTWAVLYGLFEHTFEIQLFDGLLTEWLQD